MISILHSSLACLNRDMQGSQLFTYLPLNRKSLQLCSFLFRRGWIRSYQLTVNNNKRVVRVQYKYHSYRNSFARILICSSFGNRNYCTYAQLLHLCSRSSYNTYYILSTSKGFLSSNEALSFGIGGELICHLMF